MHRPAYSGSAPSASNIFSAKDRSTFMPKKPKEPELIPVVSPESPLVPNAKLRQIYTMMLHAHLFAERFCALAAEGRVSAALHPAPSEEALLAATSVDLRAGDTLCVARQDWLAAMLKGSAVTLLARYLLASTSSRPRSFRDATHHVAALSSDLEAHPSSAIEAALNHKRKKGSLAILYTNGGASIDAWEKALQLAGRRRLPLLMVCRTPAIHTPSEAIPRDGSLESLAQASGIPHILVDGSDALAVYRVAQEANGRARRGIGATLIECQTENSAPISAATKPSVSLHPIAGMERHLAAKGIFTPEWKEDMQATFTRQLNTAFAAATARSSGKTVTTSR